MHKGKDSHCRGNEGSLSTTADNSDVKVKGEDHPEELLSEDAAPSSPVPSSTSVLDATPCLSRSMSSMTETTGATETSADPSTSTGRKRKRTASSSTVVVKRVDTNSRERWRQQHVNGAFSKLRKLLPTYPIEKKLSKQEILRRAIKYIKVLEHILKYFEQIDEDATETVSLSGQLHGSTADPADNLNYGGKNSRGPSRPKGEEAGPYDDDCNSIHTEMSDDEDDEDDEEICALTSSPI
ncbi:putative T-cell acute lymphocytic leukemia protein 1 [Hypsibius exemplaris]|uniref:T-cell acute lymphocytic leukemia protein 1 n=1 Tax=Hypsibius exemplaris TaxID=2072580 RepID=A0A1W0WP71_HYPEX|nr:putative T-cell acute lymphocytic leukemia protein 1 [Hypsibius exemplaris]